MAAAVVSALAALVGAIGGAWWGGRVARKASETGYRAQVHATQVREWSAALRAAVSSLTGKAHYLLLDAETRTLSHKERIEALQSAGVAWAQVRLLLNRSRDQVELSDLCGDLYFSLEGYLRLSADNVFYSLEGNFHSSVDDTRDLIVLILNRAGEIVRDELELVREPSDDA